MKNVLVFSLILLLSSSVYAQLVTVGPKVGISHSTITSKGVDQIKAGDSSVGFHAGIFVRISVLGFYVQPEALFTSTNGQIKIDDPNSSTVKAAQNLTYNKLDVPVMLGFKIGDYIRLNAGPSFSLILNRKSESIGSEVKSNYKNATVGYQFGVGLDLNRLVLDLRYENNLSALGTDVTFGGKTFQTDLRNRLYTLSVGYKLFQ